jgi:hypothetical protein
MTEGAQEGRSEYQDLAQRIVELTEEVRRLRAEGSHQGHHGLGFSEDQWRRYTAVRNRLGELGIDTDDFRAYLNVLNLLHHDEGGLIRFVRPC